MRLLFVADGRSPIALNWIDYFVERGHEVHLASTFPCLEDARLKSLSFVPVAFSGAKVGLQKESSQASGRKSSRGGFWGASALPLRTLIRQWLGPLTLSKSAQRLDRIVSCVNPELIHAMRIPYEGMLAARSKSTAPLLISVWGNDFTLHAPATTLTAHHTRLALRRANALHTDCQRDRRLAYVWGFDPDKQVAVLPGAGGVQPELFYPPALDRRVPEGEVAGVPRDVDIPASMSRRILHGGGDDRSASGKQTAGGSDTYERDRTIINPRGFRAYVRNDTFFRAIPLVLQRQPKARFLCPAMAEEPRAWRWVREMGVAANVDLLPTQTRPQMAELFRRSRVAVSATTHDGTPNTLLEAMACGCLPVAGDIESIREWIEPGKNGLLFDPADHQSLAYEILRSLEDEALTRIAVENNTRLIAEKAAYPVVMAQAQLFYENLIDISPSASK
jgi:glycosyltransferase involved in cell wall biosynthesis